MNKALHIISFLAIISLATNSYFDNKALKEETRIRIAWMEEFETTVKSNRQFTNDRVEQLGKTLAKLVETDIESLKNFLHGSIVDHYDKLIKEANRIGLESEKGY